MYSVTSRTNSYKQPYGGYVPAGDFKKEQLSDDELILHEKENIHGIIVGLAVDYLTSFILGSSRFKSFNISIKGAGRVDFYKKIEAYTKESHLLKVVNLLPELGSIEDDKTIINACLLVSYDVAFRNSPAMYDENIDNTPDKDTINNIRTLVKRTVSYLEETGPITKDGFTFEGHGKDKKGGYTDIISSGDGDFLTKDTIWDLKVLKSRLTAKHTLQLITYYLMGLKSKQKEFKTIENLGFINPRLNLVYTYKISDISEEIINQIEHEVIGY